MTGYNMASQSGHSNVISLCERRSSADLGDDVPLSRVEVAEQQREAWREIALEYKALAEAKSEETEQARANAQTTVEVMRGELASRTASSRAMFLTAGLAGAFLIGRSLTR